MVKPVSAEPSAVIRSRRETYRHGDLRRALIDAGVALAREGGPDAVVLREATRRAGVTPNAAYRHFASHHALFDAVRTHALGALAQAIEREWTKALKVRGAVARARALLRVSYHAFTGVLVVKEMVRAAMFKEKNLGVPALWRGLKDGLRGRFGAMSN
jgi:AcrR family transcriptional regulator